MKRQFLILNNYAAKFNSRRFPAASRHASASYKEDGSKDGEDPDELKTPGGLLKRLQKMQVDLEASFKSAVENEVKAKLEEQLKTVNEQLKAMSAATEVKEIKETLDKTVEVVEKMASDAKVVPLNGKQEAKSFSEQLKEKLEEKTDGFQKLLRKEKGFNISDLNFEIKTVGDITTSNVTTGTRYGSVMAPGVIYLPNRKVHIRSLLPGGSVGPGNTYTFMREVSTGEENPEPVAEGALKQQFDMDLEEASVNIETIAGWVRFTRKAMNNIPGFLSWLQMRMPQKLMNVEDTQILYGDGSTPNIKGILTSGNFQASTSTAPILVERLIDDIAVLEDTYEREATAILFRPLVYADFFKNKAAGSGEYDLPDNVSFINGVLYISGVPAYSSTAVTSGDYVVGDFANGAQLLTQEGMRIEFFEQDGDNVKYNKITARIEETIALPVYGDNYFIKGTTT